MSVQPKAPLVYKPTQQRAEAPTAVRPQPNSKSHVQLNRASGFRLETRSAPPVYRAQSHAGSAPVSVPNLQSAIRPLQPQSQYELTQPLWVGNGRQQIRVKIKGSPTAIGSVDLHFNQPGRAYISDLEVNQSHRRHGVGTMLMKAALESARRYGSSATELEARPGTGSISGQSLVTMYKKLGFRDAGSSRRGNIKLSTGYAGHTGKSLQSKTITNGRALPPSQSAARAPRPGVVQRMEGPKEEVPPDWIKTALALRYKYYILPLERLGDELIRRKIIHVNDEDDYSVVMKELGGLFKAVHATRSVAQDKVRAKLPKEALEYSKGLREGHKDEWIILLEAIEKNFATAGILDRELTEQDRIFILQYMIHGATRTRPTLRQQAQQAYDAYPGPLRAKL